MPSSGATDETSGAGWLPAATRSAIDAAWRGIEPVSPANAATPESVNVAGRAGRSSGKDIGSEIAHRPDGRPGRGQVAGLRGVVGSGDPEVGELGAIAA